jgi:DNA-binding NtrC family response regulator
VDLLRVLQDRKYRSIGGNREKEANVRIVAATNIALDQLLLSGLFRSDLYYRLCVFSITLPPLRSRKEDIPALAAHFLKKHAPAGRTNLRLASSATAALLSWDWPGNVRELENAIMRGIHLCSHDLIEVNDLGLAPDGSGPAPATQPAAGHALSFRALKRATIESFEKNYLARLMSEHRGNVSEAARASGKERRDLGKLLRKYQLDPKSFRFSIAETPPQL